MLDKNLLTFLNQEILTWRACVKEPIHDRRKNLFMTEQKRPKF